MITDCFLNDNFYKTILGNKSIMQGESSRSVRCIVNEQPVTIYKRIAQTSKVSSLKARDFNDVNLNRYTLCLNNTKTEFIIFSPKMKKEILNLTGRLAAKDYIGEYYSIIGGRESILTFENMIDLAHRKTIYY